MKSILILSTVLFLASCKKDIKEECPLKPYNIECDVRTWDAVFGGYNTGTSQATIYAHCPEDAQKEAADMSYDYGQIYQRCRVIP